MIPLAEPMQASGNYAVNQVTVTLADGISLSAPAKIRKSRWVIKRVPDDFRWLWNFYREPMKELGFRATSRGLEFVHKNVTATRTDKCLVEARYAVGKGRLS